MKVFTVLLKPQTGTSSTAQVQLKAESAQLNDNVLVFLSGGNIVAEFMASEIFGYWQNQQVM
jgi:hypothetical protein